MLCTHPRAPTRANLRNGCRELFLLMADQLISEPLRRGRERGLERGALYELAIHLDSPTSTTRRRHMPSVFSRQHSHAASLCGNCCSSASRRSCVRLENEAVEAARNCQRVKVDVAAKARTTHRPAADEASQREAGIAEPPQNDMHGSERASRIQHTHEGKVGGIKMGFVSLENIQYVPPNDVYEPSRLDYYLGRPPLACSDTAIARHSRDQTAAPGLF